MALKKKKNLDKMPPVPKPSTQKPAMVRRSASKSYLDQPQNSQPPADAVRQPIQLRLTDKELEEEQTRMLSANCPSAPDNIIHFSYRDKMFKADGLVSQTEFHISVDGPYLFADESYGYNNYKQEAKKEELQRNQFNFSNRGTQASIPLPKDQSVATNPPPSETTKGEFNRSVIYDRYKEQKRMQAEGDAVGGDGKKGKSAVIRQIGDEHDDPLVFTSGEGLSLETQALTLQKASDNSISAICSLSAADLALVSNALLLAERLVAEILFADVVSDYKFWSDPSDSYKQEGSLLPLWKFATNFKEVLGIKTVKPVSCIQFHPKFHDLFAAAYGSFEFQSTSVFPPSCLSVFSLKNPFYPERIIKTPVDILCLDWHPERSDLLLVGLYDGNIAMYNAADGTQIVISDSSTGKHTEAVWSVRWRKDLVGSNSLAFFSASTDGCICSWTLVKTDLRLVSKIDVRDNMTDADVTQPISSGKDAGLSAQATTQVTTTRLHSDPLNPDLAAAYTSATEKASKSTLHTKPQILITQKNDFDSQKRSAEIANQTSPTAGILSISFNPKYDWLYAISTDSGIVRLCSTAYHNTYVQTFCQNGHSMPVYGISWNTFNPDLLVSCSEDFTCKIWKRDRATPVYTVDFGRTVSDVTFSPHVSTEIIAGTADGKIVVYDFNIRKETPLCIQTAVPIAARLTKIELSKSFPIIAVGDSQGVVRVFKLSPNLLRRHVVEQPKARGPNVKTYTQEELAQLSQEGEEQKLEEFVRWCIKANSASGID